MGPVGTRADKLLSEALCFNFEWSISKDKREESRRSSIFVVYHEHLAILSRNPASVVNSASVGQYGDV